MLLFTYFFFFFFFFPFQFFFSFLPPSILRSTSHILLDFFILLRHQNANMLQYLHARNVGMCEMVGRGFATESGVEWSGGVEGRGLAFAFIGMSCIMRRSVVSCLIQVV
ncbi:hypothetical protein R3P38DRAFT_616020 [Favolaschia claudopus]|uniref:Secreted protein n=1 Tax=Favolaschia claudopus TaxID=2862362 RepID=A0AAW0CAW0_9AGAR